MQFGNYRFDQELALHIAEKAIWAIVILVVTWAVARAAKWAFAKLVDNVAIFRRSTGNGTSLGESLGKIVSLLIWLFGLLILLSVLGLGNAVGPLNTLLDSVMAFIPRLVGAALIFFIGLMIARIVRDLVVTTLQTIDFDKWANRGGIDTVTGNSAISRTIGTILYALIVIFAAILALDALDLQSVSAPASNMLQLIFDAIPRIIGAALLLGIGYLIGRFLVPLIKDVLVGLGVDRALGATELLPDNTTATDLIARVAQIAIVLFFAIAATRLLGFPELTAILDQVLELGGRVVFGAVVILVGFLIARLLVRMISGAGETNLAGTIIKWATIFVFTFMGLSFMQVGDEIVRIFFSAMVIGGAVAAALAFGLGGRNWAARKLEEWDAEASSSSASNPPRGETGNDPLPPGA
ncbi:mechanosensitive ion channel [Pelagerythrobacter marensis]|uniref:Small-conductance mechanosensitive channel n=1 Tax=Pelagerythrobacter marensis TaxID=543877 RepID=A0ABZ2D972_9SPHN